MIQITHCSPRPPKDESCAAEMHSPSPRGSGSKPDDSKRSSHWEHVRAVHLHNNPLCAACGASKALQVHHKKPFHLHPDLELEPSNLITLCEQPGHDCHFVFGHAGNWHGYVSTVEQDAATHLEDVKKSNELAKGVVFTDDHHFLRGTPHGTFEPTPRPPS